MANKKARVIAIYLPQFHPIPENDETWGKGFTEWTNVAQARPLFKGHYQPHIPADLGFYDLRMPEIREMQADLARKAGIEGFAYYQYYFGDGKMLLQRPFEEVLKSGNPDFPFCLYWANHSWQTKSWKPGMSRKEGSTMIMEQKYDGVKQYTDHFYYNLPAFKDSRYIKIDGKPLFIIWDPMAAPEQIALMIQTWQKLAIENGLKGIHFMANEGEAYHVDDFKKLGFDSVHESHHQLAINGSKKWSIWHKIRYRILKKFDISIYLNKSDFGKNHHLLVTDEARRSDVFPTLCAGFDRSPRSGKKAEIFYNFNPDTWREHIKNVFKYIIGKDPEHNIVMLKSWNEWGESNHMEPDLRYGTSLLDVLKSELDKFNKDC